MAADAPWVLAIDAGTTSVRSRAVFVDDRPTIVHGRELHQFFPRPGWVEHDAEEIWTSTVATMRAVIDAVGTAPVTIGITNQRETVVAWSRAGGQPLHRAIVWQDRRTAERCATLQTRGHTPLIRERTGLVLDPYFSASKFEWLLGPGGVERSNDLALGTVDSWLVWKLTGGAVHATDASNASRTQLFDIRGLTWDPELAELWGVPLHALGEVRASSGHFGVTDGRFGAPPGLPITGVAGDQQSALFGQGCVSPGMAKNTYGTGSFVLLNVGGICPDPVDGMLTSVAWTLGDGARAYALEGSIFSTGGTIQWLRDALGIIDRAADLESLALRAHSTDGMFLVPAFNGLGTPWWDPHATAAIVGLTRGSGRAQLARAAIESIVFQVRDAVEAMSNAGGAPLRELRVDGGASVMDTMLQWQADQLGVPVRRPADLETTSLGAAHLAGLAAGVWPSLDALAARPRDDTVFHPDAPRDAVDSAHRAWRRALARSRQQPVDDSTE